MATIVPQEAKSVPEGYVVIDKISKNGNKYQVGVPEEAAELQTQQPKPPARAAPGEIHAMGLNLHTGGIEYPINPAWEIGKDWQNTTDEVRDNTGIVRYKIDDGGFFLKYRLWVRSNRTAFYNFHDREPDNYALATILDHDHYIDFNSRDAHMVSVEVSDIPLIPH